MRRFAVRRRQTWLTDVRLRFDRCVGKHAFVRRTDPVGGLGASEVASPTTSAQIVGILLAEATRRGLEPEPLLVRVGLAGFDLVGPEARVPRFAEHRLWDAIADAAGAPAFGLEVAQTAVSSGAFGLLQYGLAASGSLRSAGAWLQRSLSVLYDGDDVLFEVGDSSCRIGVRGACRSGSRHSADCVLGSFVLMARQWLGEGFSVAEVHFLHRRPRSLSAYESVFGRAALRFGSDWNAVVFSNSWLDVPFAQGDAVLFSLLDELAVSKLESRPEPVDLRLEVARRALVEGGFGLSAACRALGMSPRSLQRLLEERGTTFRRFRDEMRAALAQNYLGGPLPLKQIAERLGFGDVNAFSRAFRRWTGTRPSSFRTEVQRRAP
jgi:AraC-like DNA-binding protein